LPGLFGNDDQHPSPAQVDQYEAELKRNAKACEFHRYDGATMASSATAPRCTGRSKRLTAGKVFGFFNRDLSG
jgi:carboxymethylenebutenolidase